jgi:hypothetical protein
MTDIIIDDSETLTVVSPVLKVQGHDMILDSADRRKPVGPTFRRAIVHDENDGLTINFNEDYPGGVTINGIESLVVKGDISFTISHHDEVLLAGGNPPNEVVSLGEVIKTLRQQIRELQAKVGLAKHTGMITRIRIYSYRTYITAERKADHRCGASATIGVRNADD